MAKRQETELLLQSKIEQLQREIDRMKYAAVPVTTMQSVRIPTPAERYVVNPRSRVRQYKTLNINKINLLFILSSLLRHLKKYQNGNKETAQFMIYFVR